MLSDILVAMCLAHSSDQIRGTLLRSLLDPRPDPWSPQPVPFFWEAGGGIRKSVFGTSPAVEDLMGSRQGERSPKALRTFALTLQKARHLP